MSEPASVRCVFYLREPAAEGGFFYDVIDWRGPGGDAGVIPPPAIGDRIFFPHGGGVRVLERQWSYPAYGSMNWPHGKAAPSVVGLDVIVERADGIFVNQELRADEEE